MKFIDWFAGIGGFRIGMELAGHECVGFCEFDKYAVMSYTAMHLCTQVQLDYLSTLPFKERQKEILKEEYRNGEWYANDVRSVDARSIPDSDCWCFGFPCQDISVAGKQLGFTGNRSSLFFRVMYLVGQLEEEKRPTYLFIENVEAIAKNMYKEGLMKEYCGNCKYNKYAPDGNGVRNGKFYCGNEESSEYGVPTFYDDSCDDFEEKE